MNRQHFISNYIGMAILAVSGFAVNLLVDFFFGSASLAYINTASSAYIVLTQLATWGQQLYVQEHLPSQVGTHKASKTIALAIRSTTLTSFFFSLLSVFLFLALQRTDLIPLAIATLLMGPAKLLTFSQIGLGRLHSFAIANCCRPLAFMIAILTAGFSHSPTLLQWSFFFAEAVTLAVAAILSKDYLSRVSISLKSALNNIRVGAKSFGGIALAELNSRLDLIVLTFVATSSELAIYSTALIFFEGYYQGLLVIRNLISRNIAFYYKEDVTRLRQYTKKIRNASYAWGAFLCFSILAAAPYFLAIYKNSSQYTGSKEVYLIVLLSQLSLSGYLVFENFAAITGHAKTYMNQKAILALGNLILQILMYKLYHLQGTAIATGISYIAIGLSNFYLIKKISSPKLTSTT